MDLGWTRFTVWGRNQMFSTTVKADILVKPTQLPHPQPANDRDSAMFWGQVRGRRLITNDDCG